MSSVTTETMSPEDYPSSVVLPSSNRDAEDETNEISSSDEDGNKNKTGKKRSHPEGAEDDDDDKKAERRAANRRSAFQSRQRRKILIEDLQRTVAALSKDNVDLRKNNDNMRVQLEAVLLENRQFRMQQQLSGQSPGAGLLGPQSLQSATALSQLLAARGASNGSGTTVSSSSSANTSSYESAGDQLLNARLALAMSQARAGGDKLNQSQQSVDGGSQSSTNGADNNSGTSSPTGSSQSGMQHILNAASLANAPGGLAGLQGLLQNPGARNVHQLAGLQGLLDARAAAGFGGAGGAPFMGLLDQLRGGPSSGSLTDIQRVLAAQQEGAMGGAGDSKNSNNTVSDALRALLQKKK